MPSVAGDIMGVSFPGILLSLDDYLIKVPLQMHNTDNIITPKIIPN